MWCRAPRGNFCNSPNPKTTQVPSTVERATGDLRRVLGAQYALLVFHLLYLLILADYKLKAAKPSLSCCIPSLLIGGSLYPPRRFVNIKKHTAFWALGQLGDLRKPTPLVDEVVETWFFHSKPLGNTMEGKHCVLLWGCWIKWRDANWEKFQTRKLR